MELAFTARGHEHILATHRSTLAFTREDWLTMRGDCIVAVSADFEEKSLRKFLEKLPDASPIVILKRKACGSSWKSSPMHLL